VSFDARQLHDDLAELASRYIEHYQGCELDGLAAQQQVSADGFNQRLERIERRLELA